MGGIVQETHTFSNVPAISEPFRARLFLLVVKEIDNGCHYPISKSEDGDSGHGQWRPEEIQRRKRWLVLLTNM